MSKVKILTDSGSDLPLTFLNEYNVTLLPLQVHLDDKEYEDVIAINPKVIYDAMRSGKAPKTSQVSPNTIKDKFTELAIQKQPSVYIAFSSELSGTYQTAVMIREQVLEDYPELDLTIIDSKCASLGHGLVVLHAAKLAENGASKETIINEVNHYCQHMEHLFTVDDLEYLRRGGRVSRASAFVGGLLNVKPLLNVEDGKLIPLEKHRGRKKLFNRIIELMEERGVNLEDQLIGISHGDDEETALQIKQSIEEKFGSKHFLINMVGSTIGAHSGPGTIAIFFLNEKANTQYDIS
ncbi:DegV family protein [Caldibacillus lycopersici]|uniref:DegV family protein n=1 Tax=Perspicuibacillus lycopersici TaxID=1325689 RepID=A0AAE3IS93_9BACI|nr:DegV family protein [Perspicuibacillus lycopersici]MCU9612456.1 DegV family protein [Perspicuibacillus lycopersici]